MISQTTLANALGMTKQNVSKLKKQGMPTDAVESAQAWRVARQNVAARKAVPALLLPTQPVAPPPAALALPMRLSDLGAPDEDYQAARTRREVAEANLAEVKEAEVKGKLLDKAEVDSAIFEIARAMCDGLTNCAKRIAAEVAALGKADDCEAVIEREHRALLESMLHQMDVRISANTPQGAL
jgi:hypothetical protein